MTNNYTHIINLAKEVEPPEDGILTRTLFNEDDVKAVIFGFGQGEELSEHTACGYTPFFVPHKVREFWVDRLC